ncbi:MAG: CPBP family intramembrane metalloprotease [Kiritimatiellales bacterium]|nr:CPBP family intramembrane metalloprotease [Kiritimatiellales bacterium]
MDELSPSAESGTIEMFSTVELALLIGGVGAIILLLFYHRKHPPNIPVLVTRIGSRAISFVEIYAIILLYLFLFILAMFSGRFFYAHQIPSARLVIALIIYSIVSFFMFANTWRREDTLANGFGLGYRQIKYLALAPLFYLALVPLLMLSVALMKWMGYALPLQETARQFVESSQAQRILFAVMAIIAAPFFEELLFRGILFPALLKRTGLISSTLLVSSLFALLHFHFFVFLILFGMASIFCVLFWPSRNRWMIGITRMMLILVLGLSAYVTYSSGTLHSFVALMVLSAGTCAAYLRTGSLWASMGMHAIFNAVTLFSLNGAG